MDIKSTPWKLGGPLETQRIEAQENGDDQSIARNSQ